MKKKQITFEEREYIEYLRNTEGRSVKKISKILKRSKSSISEELHRVKGRYIAEKAQRDRYMKQYHKTKDWKKIVSNTAIKDYVELHIKEDWSPEEISGRIKHIDTHIPYISTKSIYSYIYSIYGRKLEGYLRYGKKNKKETAYPVSNIANRTFIDERPKRVLKRKIFGDWEADFICSGKDGKGYLVVFVERKTRYIVIRKINTKDVQTVYTLFQSVLGELYVSQSLTVDNDIVFRRHEELSSMMGVPIYFTFPYHSWEKGTVENMNKWIRQYVKKGSDISSYTDEYIREVEEKLNNRPRVCLKFRSPKEALMKESRLRKDIVLIQSTILTEGVRI
jgi:IS30 family transposase